MKPLTIGVTDCSKFELYNQWILDFHPSVSTLRLSVEDNSFAQIGRCHGIVLTGGEDVHPRYYSKPEWLQYCYDDDVNEERDELEWKILSYSQVHSLPVLGICRGLQITNVFFGGTLIPDIPTWGKFNHGKLPDDTDRYHAVKVDPDSALFRIVQEKEGMINSNHHQSVGKVGHGLVVSALSEDGVVEALERREPGSSYLSLVQWHPERMHDQESPFVKNIRRSFFEACLSGAELL